MISVFLKRAAALISLSFIAIAFQNCQNAAFNGGSLNEFNSAPILSPEPEPGPKPSSKITEFVFKQSIKIDANFAQHMTSIDLDGDGDLDLILAESTRNKISLVLNDGNGNFSISTSLSASSSVYSRILTDDLNSDGKYDITVASKGGVLNVWVNDGNNNFPNRLDFNTSNGKTGAVNFIAAGDINNDGHIDIAIANTANADQGSVSVLINNGLASLFTEQITIGEGLAPYGVSLTDLNNDSKDDLVFTSQLDDKIYVFKSLGNSFEEVNAFAGSTDPNDSVLTDLVSADLDNDGNIDLVWGSECKLGKLECHKDNYDQKIYVAYGDGDFKFTETDHKSTNAYGDVRSLGLFDVNNDGKLDIISIDDINSNPFAGQGEYASISFLINKGKKKFKKVQNKMLAREVDTNGIQTTPGSSYSNSFAFGDFNNDGLNDFAADAKINGARFSSGTRIYFGKNKTDDDPTDVLL